MRQCRPLELIKNFSHCSGIWRSSQPLSTTLLVRRLLRLARHVSASCKRKCHNCTTCQFGYFIWTRSVMTTAAEVFPARSPRIFLSVFFRFFSSRPGDWLRRSELGERAANCLYTSSEFDEWEIVAKPITANYSWKRVSASQSFSSLALRQTLLLRLKTSQL